MTYHLYFDVLKNKNVLKSNGYLKHLLYFIFFIPLSFYFPVISTVASADVSTQLSTDSSNESAYNNSEQLLKTIKSKGVTIAYRLDSAPMQFQNSLGHADGILIDLWRLWSIKSGIPVHFIGAYNKEAQDMIKDGRADFNAGVFESKKRAQFLDFSIPITDSSYQLFYQKTLPAIDSIDAFKEYTVGVTRGSFHENYLRENYPELKLVLYDGYQNLFAAAKEAKVDGFVTQAHYLNFHLSEEKYNPEYKYLSEPLYIRSYKATVKKGNHALLAIINQYLPLITPEDRRVISQNWLGKFSVISFGKSSIKFSDKELQWLNNHPVIDVGVDGNWPPIDFMNRSGNHSGIVHDFLNHISQEAGITFNIIPGPTFNQMLGKVSKGEIKLAASVVETPERAKDLWFTHSFFTVQKVIISKKDGTNYQNPDDLVGKVVAIEEGFSTMKQLQQLYPEIQLKPVKSTLDALKQVSWGNADAYIGNGAAAQWLITENQVSNLEFTGDPNLGPALQRFAVNKDPEWQPLVGIINKVLAKMDYKHRKQIYQQWLGAGDSVLADNIYQRIELSLKEQDWLKEHKNIRLGIDRAWPPIEFIDQKGNYQGLSAEFIKIIASSFELNMIPIENLSWEQVMDNARAKQLDVIPALMKTQQRSEYLNFTKPYLTFPFVIFVQDEQGFTIDLTDLYGKTVAVEKAYVTEEYLKRDHPGIKLKIVENTLEGLNNVSLGLVDAYVGNLAVGSYLLTNNGINNVKVGGTTSYHYDLSIGIRKDWPELLSILNKFLDVLTNEDKAQIRKKWLSVQYNVVVDDSIVRQILMIASVILIIVFIWGFYIKRKHKLLSQSEEQLNQIINTIPLAIVITDKSGVIRRANPHVAIELECLSDSVAGRNINDFFDVAEEKESIRRKLLRERRVKDEQVHFRTDTGAIVTGLFSSTPVYFANHLFNIGMFVNLTERIKIEEALKLAKEESEQASQFKSNFLANMSHEIRTPMNAIIGMTHLAMQTSLNEKQYDYINKVNISAHNLLGIINDILDFSKIEAGKLTIEKTEFNLDDVLNNLGNLVNIKAEEKGLELLFKRDLSINELLIGDPMRLGQVLINLVQNAIKFTMKGEIIVSATLVNTNNYNIQVEFSVSDTGVGIDPGNIQQLFSPFVQADSSISRKHGGTGLGLSICKQLIGLMGGELSVQSTPGKGSCFRFTLNFKKQSGAASTHFNVESDLRGTKVLLVDDNPVAQAILQEMLESFSFQVSVVSSAKAAYELLEQVNSNESETVSPYKLVLMDWRMPETDGIEAAKHIRSNLFLIHQPKIIMITAYGRDELMRQAESDSLDGLLIKPVNPSTLFDTITSLFKKQAGQLSKPANAIFTRRLKGTVLLAEDNAINQQVARELLEGFGLLVIIANNGVEAIKFIHENKFQLVFMDIQMPEMDGLKATHIIRSEKQFDKLPIIAMTAHAMAGDKELCLVAGMDDYLSKPIDPEQLLDKLIKWLGKGVEVDAYSSVNDYKNNEEQLLPTKLPGVDLKWGLQRVGGNQTLFIKLLTDFYQNYKDSCVTLKKLVQSQLTEDACRLIHTINGISGNIGARDLQNTAQLLESLFKENWNNTDFLQTDELILLIKDFCKHCTTVFDGLNSINKALENQNEIVNNNDMDRDYNNKSDNKTSSFEYKETVNKLVQLLSEGDSESLSVMIKLKNLSNLSENESVFLTLEQQINDYEYDNAIITMSLLKEK